MLSEVTRRSVVTPAAASTTLASACGSRLARLCHAVELGTASERLQEAVQRLAHSWQGVPSHGPPVWRSPIGDDGTPFEFSLSIGATSELRVLLEPMSSPPSLPGNRGASLALLAAESEQFDLDLERLTRIQDLFLPETSQGAFALCLAVGVSWDQRPKLKAYFDPFAHGRARAPELVAEALERLGLAASWPIVAHALRRRRFGLDEIKYFSLDLSRSENARIKVYIQHHACSLRELESAVSVSPWYHAGEVNEFVRAIAPECEPAFFGRTPLTCLAFVQGEQRPTSVTVHLPVNGYVADDATIEHRVHAYLLRRELDCNVYSRAVRALATRRTFGSVGLQTYVSLTVAREQRVTVYLAGELYQPGEISVAPTTPHTPPLADLLSRFEGELALTRHPFFVRLRRESVALTHLWRLLANMQISISENFARWLAQIVARVEDDRIRSILSQQLNDELGNGDFKRAHVHMFTHMMRLLAPFRPAPSKVDESLAPGRTLMPRLAALYNAADQYEAVGAVAAGEIFGKQVDCAIGDEFRRQTSINAADLTWLMVHESLEVEHADMTAELAGLVPHEHEPAARRGALRIYVAGLLFFDELYAHCYCAPSPWYAQGEPWW